MKNKRETPNDLLWTHGDGHSFIYTPNYKLIVASKNVIHSDIIEKHKDDILGQEIADPDEWKKPKKIYPGGELWGKAIKTNLIGRIVKQYSTRISFWNNEEEMDVYKKLLIPCINELLKRNLIDMKSIISSPVVEPITISQLLKSPEFQPQDTSYWKKQAELHLASPMDPMKNKIKPPSKTTWSNQAALRGVSYGEGFKEWLNFN